MAMAVSRPPKDWLKFKIPNAPAVKREAAEEWGKATSYEFPSVRYPTDMHTTGALRCISAGNLSTLSRDQAYLRRRPGEQTPPLKRGLAWREQRD